MSSKLKFGLCMGLFVATSFASGCKDNTNNSGLTDIFNDDVGTDKRRDANDSEILWTVALQGCTGALISPEYLLTANHCSPQRGATYTSGSAIVAGTRRDITVEQVVEANQNLDYTIVKVRWANGFPKDQKLPPKIATSQADVEMSLQPNNGDELFTVGFPQDKGGRPTYSEGRAKEIRGNNFVYNIGTINGNSGGSVWRKSDGMLVSMTNAGPNQFGQGAWQGNRKSDRSHWNFGVSMAVLYQYSNVVKDVFPNGVNRFVEVGSEADKNKDEKLFVALGNESADGSTEVFVSAVEASDSVIFCINKSKAECTADDNDGDLKVLDTQVESQKRFQFVNGLSIENDMRLTIIALDNKRSPINNVTIKFNEN